MIDVGLLIHDSDFCTEFNIVRTTGNTWFEGEQITSTDTFSVEGIVMPSSSKDIDMLPEGDRRHGMKSFYTDAATPMHVTDTETISDICIYQGLRYKLLHVFDYSANGYYKAIGELAGDADGV